MTEYILFIDTEASGLPKKWNEPYATENNWPYAVQVSWIVYDNTGLQIKFENHFIGDDDFTISKSSQKIHGITREFLLKNGKSRKQILSLLSADITAYKPMLVGHFFEFDYHILGAEYYRTALPNPLPGLLHLCTMIATSTLVTNPHLKYLRLGELYTHLFKITLTHQHNALVDATATAACFFELSTRMDMESEIERQQQKPVILHKEGQPAGCTLPLILLIISFLCYCIL